MQKVILDLLPGGVAPIVYASQYDDGRSIRFMLTEGGPDSQYSLNGNETITAELTKPDGTETVIAVANPGAGKNYVDLVNGAEDYDQAGAYLGEIVLTRNARVIGSANFVLKVEEDAYGGQITTLTATGNPCTFSTDISDELVSLTANIVCGGGVGTPDSPIPIVGHSELNLTRCGKNLVPKGESSSSNGITFTVQDNGEVIVTGTATATAFWAVQFYIPSGSYILNGCPSGGTGCSIDVRNGRGGSDISGINGDSGSGSSFTRTEELTAWLNIRVPNGYSAPSGGLKFSPMIRLASDTSSEYAPYNGQTFTVAFGQTVYGGVYDKSGRLTIDAVKIVLDGTQPIGLANWNPNTNSRAWIYLLTTFPDLKDYEITDLNISSCKLKSDKLKTVPYRGTNGIYTNDIPSISIVGGDYWSIVVRVNDTTLENDTAINNYLSQNPIEVRYELATPIVIDVQAISPSAVVGTNNIVSDCLGDVSVTYIKKV